MAEHPIDFWDPNLYQRFTDLRLRPLLDLLSRLDRPTAPRNIVDMGCGPGDTTALLADRWPGAHVVGIDNSARMIEATRGRARPGRLDFHQADMRTWTTQHRVDVLVANNVLHWVPHHLELMPRLVGLLAPGGAIAIQVPANFTSPFHTILDDLRVAPAWRNRLSDIGECPSVHEPGEYLDALTIAGLATDVWETTYLHVLGGSDGIVEFVRGSIMRPLETRLDPQDVPRFLTDYADQIRRAYPPEILGGHSVQILPFRRIFAVGLVR